MLADFAILIGEACAEELLFRSGEFPRRAEKYLLPVVGGYELVAGGNSIVGKLDQGRKCGGGCGVGHSGFLIVGG
jgi:hypothetical protein